MAAILRKPEATKNLLLNKQQILRPSADALGIDEDWRWSSYNNSALDEAIVAAGPIWIDYVHLPEAYRA